MNLLIATCSQGHIQTQPLDVTQTRLTQYQIQARDLTCRECPQPLVKYMTRYDDDNTCCCNLDNSNGYTVTHYNEEYPHGTHCCLTCLNSPNTIHCKRDITRD